MPREREVVDPYSPPPPRKDKSGRFVRYALVAAMLGAGAYGFVEFSKGGAPLAQPAEEQVADAGYSTTPEAIPQATAPTATPSSATPPASTPSATTPIAPAQTPAAPLEPSTSPAG